MKFTDIKDYKIPEEVQNDWEELRRLSASLLHLAPDEIMQVSNRIAVLRKRIEAAGYNLIDLYNWPK